jgi:hypothetical protein
MLLDMMQQLAAAEQEMEDTISALPEADRKPLLAWLEQGAKARGDLVMLRAIRAYHKAHP